MLKRHKDLLRYVVAEMRHTLAGYTASDGTARRGDLDRELERLGIAPDGQITPRDVLPNPTAADGWARRVVEAELTSAPREQRAGVREELVERAAYSWINRLLALRALEARGLIDETLRSNPEYGGLSEALFVLRQDSPERAGGPDGGWWAVVDDACAAQAASLPGLFAPDDPAVALRPTTAALLRCVGVIGGAELPGFTLAESDAAFSDPDAIGWTYQFYQEEAKAQVYAGLKNGKKVATRDEIAAATQLFTEPYMVKWLLQNSLGRSYHEAYPRSALPDRWEYYIRPEQLDAPAFSTLESLTVLDPCMGSGHFLREAFDMLVAMYREQQPELDAAAISDRILTQHLHGIDIDPRAAQLAAFTLYARAWDLVRDERRARRQPGPGRYVPAALNLATTPDRIAPGALERHLQRHPGDRPLEPLLKGVFAALENAGILGSLLRPREHLAVAIAELRKPRQLQMQPDRDLQVMQAAIENILRTDPSRLEELLLERVAASFAAEAGGADDVAATLFGRSVERGVRLLQLLDRQYAVVVTNPPYMGSGGLGKVQQLFLELNFSAGKADLFASFLIQCLLLTAMNGRTAMVTQHSWLYTATYAGLRAVDETLSSGHSHGTFLGVLRTCSIELVSTLGTGAFSEISGEVVSVCLNVIRKATPSAQHIIQALSASRLPAGMSREDYLKTRVRKRIISSLQSGFLGLPGAPITLLLDRDWQSLFSSNPLVSSRFTTRDGLGTRENNRFIRFWWELGPSSGWVWHHKGGGYKKWTGLEYYLVDWRSDGARIRFSRSPRVQNVPYYFTRGVVWTKVAQPSLSCRLIEGDCIFDDATPGAFPMEVADVQATDGLLAYLNSRAATYLVRAISPTLNYSNGTIARLPLALSSRLSSLSRLSLAYKRILNQNVVIERVFGLDVREDYWSAAILHTLEGGVESAVVNALQLSSPAVERLLESVGWPAGWYPLLNGFDDTQQGSGPIDISELVGNGLEVFSAATRLSPSLSEINNLKRALTNILQAGPGSKSEDMTTLASGESSVDEIGSDDVAGPTIQTETFLEELSQKLQIHPISVYWLLQEIRAEGARCKPEEQRLLEDRLSVIVLRLLGHRWPKQIEAGEPVPAWADRDGIIPLLPGSGKAPLAERVRERLRAEDGDLGAQQAEALLAELTGRSLEEWLRRDFFTRHVRQFKYRPIAWHLASKPRTAGASGAKGTGRGKGGARPAPAFECLVYYHASGVGLLARLRTQYVEPLLHVERGRESAAQRAGDDTSAARANARVQELEAFTERLRRVEEQGFACAELDALIDKEPLDRWSGDGILAPSGHDALLAQEQAWLVDGNDGVRVNIAPLQLADVLAADVLKEPDARKAIADRARWRADERRWVRDGVLPRCGWMSEDIPESPRWTERAPEREAERARLEAKRAEALRKLEHSDAR